MSKQDIAKRGRKPSKGPSVFSKNLKMLMEEKRLSSRDICRITGCSPSVISQWLTGSQPSDPMAVLKLANSLGVDFQHLVTGVRPMPINGLRIEDLFNVEEAADFSGIFLIEAKRLKLKK